MRQLYPALHAEKGKQRRLDHTSQYSRTELGYLENELMQVRWPEGERKVQSHRLPHRLTSAMGAAIRHKKRRVDPRRKIIH